ncbi:MAG: hypothetical protein PWQ06_1366 [Anaerophaga sp.]|nr:hypothetical protein [Anaerophaga sp.]
MSLATKMLFQTWLIYGYVVQTTDNNHHGFVCFIGLHKSRTYFVSR